MTTYTETCSSCKATGPGMQDWCPPDYPAMGEMCEGCFKERHPERYAREIESYALEDEDRCEHCGRTS